tara:strand:+ start:696 stop:1070 length:375 start_codon:yes stop_codon:yes gene_type:complete
MLKEKYKVKWNLGYFLIYKDHWLKKQETSTNHSNFKLGSQVGLMLERAKLHNALNEILQEALPQEFSGLSLCLINNKNVVLIAKNSSLAFRAEKQKKALLLIMKNLDGLSDIESISIKVDKNKY